MSDGWFEEVAADEVLTQGDIVLECPVMSWNPDASFNAASIDELKAVNEAFQTDAIIMTQACDLEQSKVDSVILCPCELLSEFRVAWESDERSRNQNPTDKAFKKFCKEVSDGYRWNYTLLNHSGTVDQPRNDHRIVDFHEVYTIPKAFLEHYLASRGELRLRLRSPYREHLSQSFARFFMRVGLPVGVSELQ